MKVISSKPFPKSIKWIYKVENELEAKKTAELLDALGYVWNGSKEGSYLWKITFSSIISRFSEEGKPLFLYWDGGEKGNGITYSDSEWVKSYKNKSNYICLNFKLDEVN